MTPKKSHDSPVSYFRTIAAIIALSCIGLIFVKREVDLDETSRRLRDLEKEINLLQMKTAEANIELEALTAYPRIAQAAKQYGLVCPTKKPAIIDLNINELPPEMRQDYTPLTPDTSKSQKPAQKSE